MTTLMLMMGKMSLTLKIYQQTCADEYAIANIDDTHRTL